MRRAQAMAALHLPARQGLSGQRLQRLDAQATGVLVREQQASGSGASSGRQRQGRPGQGRAQDVDELGHRTILGLVYVAGQVSVGGGEPVVGASTSAEVDHHGVGVHRA